tara:strand:- start:627 stop:860 length:234 start_codon:yes stop_codon:yes gene_type:complete
MSKDYLDKWEERQKQNTEIIEQQQTKAKMMSKKELIEKYYKTNTVVYWSDNRYSKEYVEWLERKLLKQLNQNKEDEK